MKIDTERFRVAVERKFQPPVDLLLDPSLLATERSLGRVQDSQLLESQTQATLGEAPSQVPVESIYIPETIGKQLAPNSPSELAETRVWEFFRGKARGSKPAAVSQFLNQHNIESFNPQPTTEAQRWSQSVRKSAGGGRLGDVLAEEYQFLDSGGVILSRTPKSIEMLRDAGTTTIDTGNAPLADSLEDQLGRIGYPEIASVCAFGVAGVDSTIDALTGGILSERPGLILYKLGG